jgi:hypothetical protein
LPAVAQELRQLANSLNLNQPLATIRPALERWQNGSTNDPALLPSPTPMPPPDHPAWEQPQLPRGKNKGGQGS